VQVGRKPVGQGQPVFVIAEIGINHNGDLSMARAMIEGAARAGCDAVKFQKRTPELAVPREQWGVMRDTPWGRMSYLDYRHRVEFGYREYEEIDDACVRAGIEWFASCWDEPSVDFIEQFDPPCHKVSSACLTDSDLLECLRRTRRPVMISTGMSDTDEIARGVAALGQDRLLIAHSTSAYPCPLEALNLKMISTLKRNYPQCPIGYSGHETGLAPTWAAVALGATFVERHVTLDRAMWGSDQAASVEMSGLARLVSNIRDIERALGDGLKRVYPCEQPSLQKLRRRPALAVGPVASGERTYS
jgi:N-acetylneuraminate synthase